MRLLNRYIGKAVIVGTLIVLLILFGIEFFINFSAELSSIGHGHYGVWQAMWFVLLQMPFNLYQFFPLAAVVGSLLGLGRLASSNQLMVMRSAGYSVFQVLVAVVQAALIMLVFATTLGEGLAPWLMQYSQQFKTSVLTGEVVHARVLKNVWLLHHGNVVRIGRVRSASELRDVTVYHVQGHVKQVVQAPVAQRKGRHWYLLHAKVVNFQSGVLIRRTQQRMRLPLMVRPKLLSKRHLQVSEENLWQLYEGAAYRKASGLSYASVAYAFWQRLLQPMVSIVMIALGVPFVFGGLRSASMGWRVMIGVFIGAGFYIANQFLGLFSMVFSIPPFLAAAFPTILFALLCAWLLARV